MDDWVPKCTHDLAETCCDSISIEQLQELSDDKTTKILQPEARLDYGEIRGSKELRENLARLYSSKSGIPSPYLALHDEALTCNIISITPLTRKHPHNQRSHSSKPSRLLLPPLTGRPRNLPLPNLPAVIRHPPIPRLRSLPLESHLREPMDPRSLRPQIPHKTHHQVNSTE